MSDSATDLGLPASAVPYVAPALIPPDHRAAAEARIAALKADPAWIAKHLSGSHETKEELRLLHEQAYSPPAGMVSHGGPTLEAQRNAEADSLANNSTVSPAVIDEIRSGRPVSALEYQLAVAKKNALFRDPAWRARYFAEDHEARRQKDLIDVILSSRVAP
jgi:hypothetical protein